MKSRKARVEDLESRTGNRTGMVKWFYGDSFYGDPDAWEWITQEEFQARGRRGMAGFYEYLHKPQRTKQS